MDDETRPVAGTSTVTESAGPAGAAGPGTTPGTPGDGTGAAGPGTTPDAVTPPERGFPGFPTGDPDQLPLSRRPRGLDAAPPPGGNDPEIRQTLARERPYVRLLVGMVAVIVGGSLLLTFLALAWAAFAR